VLDSCRALERAGKATVTYLPVDKYGMVDPDAVRNAITDKTVLISIMYANNEVGTIHPVREIGRIAKERGVIFHCDAVQAVGKIPVDVERDGIDLLAMSAHKIYGPKGVGALYVRSRGPRVRLTPIIDGGGHERGMRSGTLPVPLIVGFGAAAAIAKDEMAGEAIKLATLRDRLHRGIMSKLPEVYVNGSMDADRRLPGNLNISFAFVEGESLLMALKDIAVSSGSACTSASLEPSYVLRALGVGDELAHTSIRFGIGRFNTEAEIDYVIGHVAGEVNRLREMSPLYEMVQQGIDIKKIQWAAH
jgi:cysteine desulfurase